MVSFENAGILLTPLFSITYMIQEVDFHSHTVHSDGTLTPAELVALAKERGIKALALTDHDTTGGLDEALAAGEREGVEIIPGIEISVVYEPGTMHILGYFIDHKSTRLQELLKGIQRDRADRNPQIIKKLNALGIEITLEEVVKESGGGQVGRPHFARVLINKGRAKNIEDAFRKYLGKDAPAYVNKRRVLPEEGIRMIRDAGGVAVLAHPKLLRAEAGEFDGILDGLVAAGLEGLEVYSSCQNQEEAERFKAAAERRRILVTGGSDFHGTNKADVELGHMGSWASMTYEALSRMKGALAGRN